MKRILLNTLIFSLLALLLCTCKSKEVVSPSLTTIKFELKDDGLNDVSDAKVYLFNTYSDWRQSKTNREASGAIDSTFSKDGIASININPKIRYYLLVIYKEQKRKITMMNINYDSTISDLPSNIDVKVLINLRPVDGNLGFYSLYRLASPITIDVKNQSSPFILRSSRPSSPDFASDTGLVTVNLPPGTYRFQAKNSNGCIWTGEQTLKAGEFNRISLSGCNFGDVFFYTNAENDMHLPITVTINEDADNIGQLTASKISYACGDGDESGTIKASKYPGKYTYSAFSVDSSCVWTGKFDITANQCKAIKLGKCQ